MSNLTDLKEATACTSFTDARMDVCDFLENYCDMNEFSIHVSHDDFDGMASTIVAKAIYRLLNPAHSTKDPHDITWINTSKIGADFPSFLWSYLDEFYKNYMLQYDSCPEVTEKCKINLLITDINFDLNDLMGVLRPFINDAGIYFKVIILDHHITKYPEGAQITRYSPSKGVEYVMDGYSHDCYEITRVICNSISAAKILANIALAGPLIKLKRDPFYAASYNDFVDRLNGFAAIASKYDTGHWGNWDTSNHDVDPSIVWNTMAINARTDHRMVDFIDATAKAFGDILTTVDPSSYYGKAFEAVYDIVPTVHPYPEDILKDMRSAATQQIAGMNDMYEMWAKTVVEVVGCGADEMKHRITPYRILATRIFDGGYQLVIHRLKTTDCPNPPENISLMIKLPEDFPNDCVMYFTGDLSTNVESKYNYSMFAKRFLESRDSRYQKAYPMAICRIWLEPNAETGAITVECSFRSLNTYEPGDKNYVSVRDICALNGGGGHPHAAGFRVELMPATTPDKE